MTVLAATLVAAAALGAASAEASLSPKLVPSKGALFGVFAGERRGRSPQGEIRYLERMVLRRFDLDRQYYRWNAPFPGRHATSARALGRIPVISWAAVTKRGRRVRWGAIASGRYDRVIRERANAVRAFRSRLMIVFHHEPEDDRANGTARQYRLAWRRIVSIFRARGATNAVWVWNLTAYTFDPHSRRNPKRWYPGNRYVDWIAADGYNWFGSRHVRGQPWRSFRSIFRPFYVWGTARGKPLAVLEFGVLEDRRTPRPLRKAQWFNGARVALKRMPRIKAVIYFNARGWWFDSSRAAIIAFRGMARDPYFNRR